MRCEAACWLRRERATTSCEGLKMSVVYQAAGRMRQGRLPQVRRAFVDDMKSPAGEPGFEQAQLFVNPDTLQVALHLYWEQLEQGQAFLDVSYKDWVKPLAVHLEPGGSAVTALVAEKFGAGFGGGAGGVMVLGLGKAGGRGAGPIRKAFRDAEGALRGIDGFEGAELLFGTEAGEVQILQWWKSAEAVSAGALASATALVAPLQALMSERLRTFILQSEGCA
jgi:heme-degrading monooxygenase HmoA